MMIWSGSVGLRIGDSAGGAPAEPSGDWLRVV